MKRILVLATVVLTITFIGCTKKNTEKPTALASAHGTKQTRVAGRDGGDLEDVPIIMGLAVDISGGPIAGAMMVFVNGSDTISGQTAQTGYCTVQLTRTGQWSLNISKSGYTTVNTNLDVVDSFTGITDTLTAAH